MAQGWAFHALFQSHPVTALEGVSGGSLAAAMVAPHGSETLDPTQLSLLEERFYRDVARSLAPVLAGEAGPDSASAKCWRTLSTKSPGWTLTGPEAPSSSRKRPMEAALSASVPAPAPSPFPQSVLDSLLRQPTPMTATPSPDGQLLKRRKAVCKRCGGDFEQKKPEHAYCSKECLSA